MHLHRTGFNGLFFPLASRSATAEKPANVSNLTISERNADERRQYTTTADAGAIARIEHFAKANPTEANLADQHHNDTGCT